MFRPRLRAGPVLIAILIPTLILVMIIADYRINASLLEIAKSRVQLSGMEAINQIVNQQVVANIEYKDIVLVHKDDQGRVVLIQPNTIMLNQIMSTTIVEVADGIIRMQQDSISIPMGEITGFKVLAGYGPRVKVRIIPTGQVHVEVLNKFEQAGINQTRHLIYFKVQNIMKVAVPFINDEVIVTATIPLAETIIVGDVPKTYVNFRGNEEALYPLINE